jgi:hypothetical protein
MDKYIALSVISLCLLAVIFGLIHCVSASAEQLPVAAGQETSRTLNLAVEDRVLIDFTVLGQSEHRIVFYISCPNQTAINFGSTGEVNYRFTCTDAGDYVLHFSNTASQEDKTVWLEVEVQHYIFGMPQMLFLTLIIVGLCLGAIAVFVLMGKTH